MKMTNAIRLLLISVISILFQFASVADSDENVLWWMFDETMDIQEVNGSGSAKIYELVGRGDSFGKRVNGIRIGAYDCVTDKLIGYLLIDDSTYTYDMPSINFDTMEVDSWDAGPSYANILEYSSNDASTLFAIELGNYSSDEDRWDILAMSEKRNYEYLLEHGWVYSTLSEHTMLPWTGGSYSVPEPNALMLMIIGFSLLGLKRKDV